jgi:hypothetical protein
MRPRGRRKTGDPRPLNGYLLFCAERREESPELFSDGSRSLPREQTARIAEDWRALPPDEKAVYKSRAADIFREWKAAHPDTGYDTEGLREAAKLRKLREADLQTKLEELTVGQKYGIDEVRAFLMEGVRELRFLHELPGNL